MFAQVLLELAIFVVLTMLVWKLIANPLLKRYVSEEEINPAEEINRLEKRIQQLKEARESLRRAEVNCESAQDIAILDQQLTLASVRLEELKNKLGRSV